MEVQEKTEVEPIAFESSNFGSYMPVLGRLLVRDGIIEKKIRQDFNRLGGILQSDQTWPGIQSIKHTKGTSASF